VKLLANLEREVIQAVEERNDLPDFAVRHGRLILFRPGVGAGLHVAASLPFCRRGSSHSSGLSQKLRDIAA
jgi:hypothetical protein